MATVSLVGTGSLTGWERRLSDSHLGVFERDRVLPVRRIFDTAQTQFPDVELSSTCGALACRLLDSPSSYRLSQPPFEIPRRTGANGADGDAVLCMLLAIKSDSDLTLRCEGRGGLKASFELCQGDVLAYDFGVWTFAQGDSRDDVMELFFVGDRGDGRGDCVLAFEDDLHDKVNRGPQTLKTLQILNHKQPFKSQRGYTPTTVQQWSKGMQPPGSQHYN